MSKAASYGTPATRIAKAIARAEGFFAHGDPLPRRANNPGNLKLGDVGYGMIAGKTIFGSVSDGWRQLEKQVELMLSGKSRHYKPGMSIAQIAARYTGNDNADAWAEIVAGELGVTPEARLEDVV